MKMRMPNLLTNGRATKSSSFKHLDSVVSAISLMASYLNLSTISGFLTAIQVSYQRLNYMVNIDADATITELKRLRLAYIHWVRGGDIPGVSPSASLVEPESVVIGAKDAPVGKGLVYIHEENILDTILIQSILDFRVSIMKSTPTRTLWLLDMLVIAFLDSARVIILPKSNDYSTIDDGHSSDYGNEVHQGLSKDDATPMGKINAKLTHNLPGATLGIMKELGWSRDSLKELYKAKCRAQKCYIINSAGPNGDSTWTAYSDAIAILNDPVIAKALNTFCTTSGLKRFLKKIIGCIQLRTLDTAPIGSLKLGKIITFAEWGGKTRMVAALDYWTQVILTPLHDTLFDILRSIPMDATFDQRAAASKVKAWTLNAKSELYSFDLTAATDRLPLSMQGRILGVLLGSVDMAIAWVKLLGSRPYHDENDKVHYYAVGAPMGSKSNWAMLALTHHIIVRYSADRVKVNNFTNYVICGDDIVINSSQVANSYREVVQYLGLKINENKSILYGNGLAPAAEFCKRIFVNGIEYTGLPVKLIAKTVMNGRLLPQLQNEATVRGVTLDSFDLYSWLGALTDPQSHSFLAMLNLLPSAITGLDSKIELPPETPQLATWWQPVYTLDENDLVQAYTYVAAVDQLKRVDALLRQTAMVTDAIAAAMASNHKLNFDIFAWTKDIANKPLLDKLLEYAVDLNHYHPLVEASQREAIRVSLLLTKLSNASMGVETVARAQLLDSFRNAIASMWDDTESAIAQADRSLIVKSLDTIEAMLGPITESMTMEDRERKMVSIFATKLVHLDRNWTVRWALGSNLTINTVKSRVTGSAELAQSNASTHAKVLPIRKANRV